MVDANLHGLNLGHQNPGGQQMPDDQPQPNEPGPGQDDENVQPAPAQPLTHEEVADLMAHIARLEAQLTQAQAPAPAQLPAINPSVILQQAQFAAAAAVGTAGNIPDVMAGQMAPVDLTCEHRLFCFTLQWRAPGKPLCHHVTTTHDWPRAPAEGQSRNLRMSSRPLRHGHIG